jgi:two-component system chemotaxis sensor kinase CheA
MEITFDISKDELPIFLAEVDEHLQTLDNILLSLQQEPASQELVQTVFRSAHTIKGMAGMIGHRRMTDMTHALENVLDGVRKNSIAISNELIDLCLDAVDCLRSLRDEVATSQVADVDIDEIVFTLKDLVEDAQAESVQAVHGEMADQLLEKIVLANPNGLQCNTFQIQARMDTKSMASAARAFQVVMALQDLGEIQTLSPSQQEIESASSVGHVAAVLVTEHDFEKVSAALTRISGIEEIVIDGIKILSDGLIVAVPSQKVAQQPDEASSAAIQTNNLAPKKTRTDPVGRRISDLTLRMNVEHINNLMNLVGELIIDRNHLKQIHSRLTRLNSNYDQINETIAHLGQIADQLQEQIMRIRMLPIGSVFSKFPRMVHDMSRKVGKSVNVVVHGEETEMDRSMIDEIYDPLIHLIRNSVDHGIEMPQERLASGKPEAGTVTLTARHEQGRIILTVEDDGRGIDAERLRHKAIQKGLISAEEAAGLTEVQSINLMFLAGLSTVEQVTEFSGRGVGLDIVKTNIQHVNGTIDIESQPGMGTKTQIVLPLTLAIVPSLLVRVRQDAFAIPMFMITETLRLNKAGIKNVDQKPVTLLRGKVLSLLRLSDIFELRSEIEEAQHLFAVVIQSGEQRVGLIVDALIGEEDVVVKPLGTFVGNIQGVSSAAILSNGQVALLVDVFNLFKLMGM